MIEKTKLIGKTIENEDGDKSIAISFYEKDHYTLTPQGVDPYVITNQGFMLLHLVRKAYLPKYAKKSNLNIEVESLEDLVKKLQYSNLDHSIISNISFKYYDKNTRKKSSTPGQTRKNPGNRNKSR